MRTSKVLKKLAKQEGVTVEFIKTEMQIAIDEGDWSKISTNKTKPNSIKEAMTLIKQEVIKDKSLQYTNGTKGSENKESFGEKLRRLRKEKGLTQNELSSALDYGYTAISNYEADRNQPSYKDVVKISNYFDVTPNYMLGKEDKN